MNHKQYTEAKTLLESIVDWKDAKNQISLCEQKIQATIIRKKKMRLTAIIGTPIISVVIALAILTNYVIIPAYKHNKRVEKYGEEIVDKFESTSIGQIIKFGAYEQDNNTANGPEEIEWIVLRKEATKMLVISKYALDCKQYNTSYTDVTWETCTLRKWLNEDFINSVFSANERTVIPTVTVTADKNPDYSTNPGNTTQDQVFLLGITEVNKYFGSNSARQCKPTDYAVANGAYIDSSNGSCSWFLRSPGAYQASVSNVYLDGNVIEYGCPVNNVMCSVRPAMWIELTV